MYNKTIIDDILFVCASIIAQKIQLENSKFTFVNKLMEQEEDTLTVTRQSSALTEAEKSSNYVNKDS